MVELTTLVRWKIWPIHITLNLSNYMMFLFTILRFVCLVGRTHDLVSWFHNKLSLQFHSLIHLFDIIIIPNIFRVDLLVKGRDGKNHGGNEKFLFELGTGKFLIYFSGFENTFSISYPSLIYFLNNFKI